MNEKHAKGEPIFDSRQGEHYPTGKQRHEREKAAGVAVNMLRWLARPDLWHSPPDKLFRKWAAEIEGYFPNVSPKPISPSADWTFEERVQVLVNLAQVLRNLPSEEKGKIKELADVINWVAHFPTEHLEQHRAEIIEKIT